MFENMLPIAIKAGLSIPEFWDLTCSEIIIYVRAVNEEKLEDMRVQARMVHTLGDLVGLASWSNEPYPQIEDVFPELFDAVEQKEERQEQEAMLERDKWLVFAESFNRRRGEVRA